MSLYTEDQREEHKAVVRRIITLNPTLSLRAIKGRLATAEKPIDLSVPYIMSMAREIRQDRIEAINEETKEDIYGQMRDTVEFVNQNLRAIAQEEKLVYSKTKDGIPVEKAETRIFAQNNRIKAMNSIIDNLMKLWNLKMDLGIIERKVGTVDHNIIDVMSALKKVRNGNYKTPISELIPVIATPVENTGTSTTSQ